MRWGLLVAPCFWKISRHGGLRHTGNYCQPFKSPDSDVPPVDQPSASRFNFVELRNEAPLNSRAVQQLAVAAAVLQVAASTSM